jgi:hypothetical protein
MPIPTFTPDEKCLIDAIRGDRTQSFSDVLVYSLAGMALAAFGVFYDSVWMMLSAFVILCGYRVWEEWRQARWRPILRSIVLKYDQAIHGASEAGPIAS